MSPLDTKGKKYKVATLIKDINRSKEDVIDYLNFIGVEKTTINTSLTPEVVAKVFSHFKKDIEDQEKHLKKVVDFVQKNKVEIYEADERIKREEEEKVKKAEEQRLKKIIEEEAKKKEEEKKKQELKAFLEREKTLKEQAEKDKKESLERIIAAKRKREEERAKKEEQKAKLEKEKAEAEKQIKEQKSKSKEEKKVIEDKTSDKKVKEPEAKKAVIEKPKETPKKTEHGRADFRHSHEKREVKTDHTHTHTHSHTHTQAQAAKPSTFPKDKVEHKEYKKPFEHFRPKKTKYEKVTLKDIKQHKKPFQKDKDDKSKEKPKDGAFVKQVVKPVKPEKWVQEKKDKEKKSKADYEYEKKKRKLVKGQKVKEFSQKEIDDAIRETMAKMDDESSQSARSLARKRKKKERLEQEKKIMEYEESRKNIIKVTEFLSTSELANLMSIEPADIIKKCFDLGMMVSINQRLDKDLIVLLAEEFGFVIEFQTEYKEDILKDEPDSEETLKPRPPVVTVMGHVDHGKTSLLDYIRKANVVAGEAGGITQHIGAYKVKLDSGKEISFLDTPGHEAFTAMRARGGQAADIVVLVVAADDSVMPQTVEAINHALAANVPIVIAINKIDKPNSNIEKIKKQLADNNVLIEEWGGKYQSVEISAKFGKNIDLLLEKILLEADLLELKANPDRNARGVVLESRLDRGKGIMATVLVQKGLLKIGDCFLSGIYSGRVKAMFDERENRIEIAKPATPVQILGFNGMPQAGDTFVVMDTENDVKNIAQKRQQLKREQDFRQVRFATLDDISKQIKEGKQVELNIIIKADTDGSAEALADSLAKLATNEVKVRIIHKALGQISESDVLLAEASSAIIIGFNVRPNLNARKLAEKNIVDIRIHNIIYKVIDEVKSALEGMLEPEISEEITATVEVRDVFKIPKIGNIAGCYVQDGKIIRNNKVRLVRDGFVIFDGNILSLKRIKDDVREVESGYECGIGLENYNDIKVGDIIEAYKIVETKRKLVLNK
ncbi:MAG: translation initiation factor IF-2 [Ignavibacteria bacterium]|jgi:translation initiation factor IF-2